MGSDRFRAVVVVRLVVFAALIFVAAWSVTSTDWQVVPIVSIVLAVAALIDLIRYVESVNRELASFLEFVTHDDFSSAFPIGVKGRVFARLEEAYRRLLDKYRDLNEQREINHRYLESLVEHVRIALICLDDGDDVILINRHAKRLFRIPHLGSLRALKRIDPTLPSTLETMKDGDRKLIRLRVDNEPLQLALYMTEFELQNHVYRLISFQNIRTELEEREVDFSAKLIKVLTHEIMNSVTPIIALSKVLEESLSEATATEPATHPSQLPEADDLLRSVTSIQSRSDGLLRFVQAYRNLTSLPEPIRKQIDVSELLAETKTLLAPVTDVAKVSLDTRICDEGTSIKADPEQIQQVLINLVNNAVEALDGRPDGQITLSVRKRDPDGTVISVTDNGPGIDEDQIENIFVPFFTTKRQGTGVGLSVSRQIMFQNRGLLSVASIPGRGSEFRLEFD